MWHALRGTEYTLDVDIDKVREAEEVFKDCMKDYFLPPEADRRRAADPVEPDAGRRADGQHADDARQRHHGQVSRR